jgi:hypothetical protein
MCIKDLKVRDNESRLDGQAAWHLGLFMGRGQQRGAVKSGGNGDRLNVAPCLLTHPRPVTLAPSAVEPERAFGLVDEVIYNALNL